MYKHVMNYICPNRNKLVIAISISFFLFTTGSAANAKVVEKCPTSKANQCKAGGQVLAQLINKMDSTNVDYYLWDAKQSQNDKRLLAFIVFGFHRQSTIHCIYGWEISYP